MPRAPVGVMPSAGMRIASRPLGVDVDDGVGKIRDLMQKPMVGLFCDVVSLANAQCALYPQTDLGEEAVPHPSGPHLAHRHNAWCRGGDVPDVIDE